MCPVEPFSFLSFAAVPPVFAESRQSPFLQERTQFPPPCILNAFFFFLGSPASVVVGSIPFSLAVYSPADVVFRQHCLPGLLPTFP